MSDTPLLLIAGPVEVSPALRAVGWVPDPGQPFVVVGRGDLAATRIPAR